MRFFLIFLLLPVKLLSQDIEGVWVGTIYNDTTHKYIPYEIAITGVKGKLSGFSQTIFAGENNRQETGVKSLRVKQKSSKILIEDDVLIYNNYKEPAPKGVKQYSVLNVVNSDSGLLLIGVFNTNRTKEYASLTGSIRLRKKEKIGDSKLISKLEELHLSNSLSFVQTTPKENSLAYVPGNEQGTGPNLDKKNRVIPATYAVKDTQLISPQDKKSVVNNSPPTKSKPVIILDAASTPLTIETDTIGYTVDVITTGDIPKIKKQRSELKTPRILEKGSGLLLLTQKTTLALSAETKKHIAESEKTAVAFNPVKEETISPASRQQKTANIQGSSTKKTAEEKAGNNVVTVPVKEEKKPRPIQQKKVDVAIVPALGGNPATTTNTDHVIAFKEKTKDPITLPTVAVKTLPDPTVAAVSTTELAKRKIETIRNVNFTSDSLVLTLYDNGEVDGDTVSVILNGRTIMSKQRLTEKALSKTIYITPELGDSLQLIMYAENLGSIPPNTGLLIIQDGGERYEIRFAGDLQKNSAILLRRKINKPATK